LNRSASRSKELALSLGILALGVAAAAVTATLPGEGGYAGIGPNFIPALVSAGLVLVGGWLTYEAASGGWRGRPPHEGVFHASPFVWISAGLVTHMALIGWAGFIVAGTVLFACVARGFGSHRLPWNAALGLVLSTAMFVFFVKLLNVSLPAGWMRFLL